MTGKPLEKLGTLGQSLWLDYIRRDPIVSDGMHPGSGGHQAGGGRR